MATTRTNHSAPSPAPTPLGAVLALTFLGSLGTGAVTNGFSFIASEGLGYGRKMNLLLAVVLGGTYIVGALLAGRAVAKISVAKGWLSPRWLLAIVLVVIALACQLPILAKQLAPDLLEPALWAFIIVFSPATGVFWPIVEGYLSGGRSGRDLRSAIGRFNIVWSIALVISFWLMAPLLGDHPFLIFSLLGVLQLLMCGLLCWFPAHPPKHLPEHHEPTPEVYVPLLTIFRVLLIASYIVLSALTPLLPIVEDKLGIDVHWKTPLASAWLTSRVLLFIVFERWHGWHGRWWTPWTGMGLMVVGFSACMLAPMAGGLGLATLTGGLIIVGIGIAITYYGALYYAMAVGHAEVEAGGKHEAVIGLGYTLGPLLGLAGLGLSGGEPDPFRFWVIALVTGSVLVSALLGRALIGRAGRRRSPRGRI
jgi:MFS family permease